MNDINKQLIDFISASPSAYHTVESVRRELDAAGYTELFEGDEWSVTAPGKYYVRRNGSSIIALRLPKPDFRGFMVMAAHSDSPSFKIKWNSDVKAAGMYTMLNVEKYGGMLCSTWLDRPLSVAGRAIVAEGGRMVSRLVNVDRDLAVIPNVAIHMDRSANDGKSYNANVDMLPLIGSAELKTGFKAIVAQSLGVAEDALLAGDLILYPRERGCVWGAENEFVSSARLDDLQCVYGCLRGLLDAAGGESAAVLSVFDNEEVGSGTKQGADSFALPNILMRLYSSLGYGQDAYFADLARGFLLSLDVAHALHPNAPEKADPTNAPRLGGGVTIKAACSQAYAGDAEAIAVTKALCEAHAIPYQMFLNRSDIRGGSTLGSMLTANMPMRAMDVGAAILAMHSARETMGADDQQALERLVTVFFSR